MTDHREDVPELCSRLSLAADEPAVGTAAEATCWLVLEQDGPWGAKAATQSRLDPTIGARLDEAISSVGGRFALMREPGAHPDRQAARRRVLVAGGRAAAPWLLCGWIEDPEQLLDLPVRHLTDPAPDRVLAALPALEAAADPILLVCTNGKRDRCCALNGRGIARAAAGAFPGRVFETTHLGGHRFAATAVLLPTGHAYARLDDPALASEALAAADAGRLADTLTDPLHYRGRSLLRRPQQVADHAVRALTGDWSLTGPIVDEAQILGEDHWAVRVQTSAGERFSVDVTRVLTDRLRPESCGAAPVPMPQWHTRVRMVTPD